MYSRNFIVDYSINELNLKVEVKMWYIGGASFTPVSFNDKLSTSPFY